MVAHREDNGAADGTGEWHDAAFWAVRSTFVAATLLNVGNLRILDQIELSERTLKCCL